MIRRDTFLFGLLTGLLVPILGYLVFWGVLAFIGSFLESGRIGSESFQTRTLWLVGICFNLIPLQVFQVRRWREAIRGVLLPTGIYAIVWFAVFGRHLL